MSDSAPYILLVEEDATLGDITAFRLELLGYEVKLVQSGEATLAAFDERRPDLLLLDLYLPDMKGNDLINRLKNDETWCEVPILVLSVEADLNVVTAAHQAGADDYLVTPYDPAVLQAKIEKLMRREKVTA